LEAGDLAVATARQPAQLEEFVTDFGEHVLPLALDVTNAEESRGAIAMARQHFGRLDVVVNNAGYANVSPIETADDDDVRAQFETNFWGVYNVSKAAIPTLREQRSGIIMQISSVGGRVGGSPGIASSVRQVCHRWVQSRPSRGDCSIRCQSTCGGAERLSNRLGRRLHDRA
jgi:NAD(P)-dependent dehydrogenase (short-subunit alcohol dehydrogenase family)